MQTCVLYIRPEVGKVPNVITWKASKKALQSLDLLTVKPLVQEPNYGQSISSKGPMDP